EPLDIQRLVEEFRVTLERYGVSQRNLSFLMEKGRVKRWEELSPRGRVPYIKMRMWLDSREEQARKSGPREAYNRRERFSMFQLHVLCRLFEENPNPAMNVRNAVAERLNIPLDRVNVWFQNQRARGFPAKRILQQQNGVYSSTGLEHETEASKIISSCASEQASAVSLQTTPDKIPPNMADYLLQIPLSGECIGNYHSKEHKPDVRQLNNTKVKTEPHIQVKTESPHISPPAFISQCSKYSPTFMTSPVITSPVMTSHRRSSNSPATDMPCTDQPLDLSTGSTMVQSAHRHTFTKNGKFSPHSSVSATSACDTSDVKHLTGASKRKRGFTPQQIISKHYITSQVNSIEDNNVQSPKRRRKSNDDEDTDEFEYDYVITSDDIKPSSPLNDNGAPQTKSTSDSEFKQHLENDTPRDQENIHPRAQSKLSDGDKENVVKFDPNVKPESLIQAMCASIVMEEKNSSGAEGYVMEPELD
ncbi:DUXA-like protein, partial [Mya arenaria]